jgi:hypothetical protein
MSKLVGKRVLYIGPHVFGYEKKITRALEDLGAIVETYDERPFTSSIAKILNRLNLKFFIRWDIAKHYSFILNRASLTKVDYLFVISPETMSVEFVKSIKNTNKNLHAVLYMWDSVKNKKNAQKLLPFFDRVLTFDRNDKSFLSSIEFLPLFYSSISNVNEISSSVAKLSRYAMCFIGTAHSDRSKIVLNVSEQFKEKGLDTFIFLYCPSKTLFYLKKLFTREFNGLAVSDVSFKPLNQKEIEAILARSDSVIDIEHPDQTGLTLRTIEMLGYRKKLITTNRNIKDYDFYSPNNIAVIDRSKPIVAELFMNTAYDDPLPLIVKKYSLKSWISEIFNL